MPVNHYGHIDPDYDAGAGNRDFTVLTEQGGHVQDPHYPEAAANEWRNQPPEFERGPHLEDRPHTK